jgi:hypothetical protein
VASGDVSATGVSAGGAAVSEFDDPPHPYKPSNKAALNIRTAVKNRILVFSCLIGGIGKIFVLVQPL